VNVQELQRLGDAINMTMEAIRRVAPQIAFLQQQATPFGAQQGFGAGAGVGVGVNPWLQQQQGWSPQSGQQLYPAQPYAAQPFLPGFGATGIDPVTLAYIQGHIQAIRALVSQVPGGVGANAFGQPSWPTQPYGFASPHAQQAAPFFNPQPRPF
jgi:hypothetical protein